MNNLIQLFYSNIYLYQVVLLIILILIGEFLVSSCSLVSSCMTQFILSGGQKYQWVQQACD